ncbi:hypothetical protein, partial [Myceligenerans pegani]
MSAAMAAAMEVGARSVIARNAGLEEVLSRFESVASWSAVAQAAVSAERTAGYDDDDLLSRPRGRGVA